MSRVVIVAEEHGRGNDDYQQVALGNYQDWKQQSRSFQDLAVRTYASMSLTGAGEALHVQAALTSASFFEVLRANALLGRVYQEGRISARTQTLSSCSATHSGRIISVQIGPCWAARSSWTDRRTP